MGNKINQIFFLSNFGHHQSKLTKTFRPVVFREQALTRSLKSELGTSVFCLIWVYKHKTINGQLQRLSWFWASEASFSVYLYWLHRSYRPLSILWKWHGRTEALSEGTRLPRPPPSHHSPAPHCDWAQYNSKSSLIITASDLLYLVPMGLISPLACTPQGPPRMRVVFTQL